MNDKAFLSRGRAFEDELFGIFGEDDLAVPDYLDFWSSIQEITAKPLTRENMFGEDEFYQPTCPNWGRSGEIWTAVNCNLPHRCCGERSGPLSLYIAVGVTSLDYFHGIDAFFWWMGSLVTIDASTSKKSADLIKADFILNPVDMIPERLVDFGKEVALLLKLRRIRTKIQNQIPRKFPK